MSNEGFGPGPKKETVYGGPAVATKQGTVYGGPPLQTGGGTVYGGTVYNGPAGGTVYGGPTSGGAGAQPITGRKNSSGNAGAAYGAKVFYAIAGLTVLRSVLTFAGVQAGTAGSTSPNSTALATVLVGTLIVAGIFALLGFFTKRGSKIALVIGILLYAVDLVFLVLGNPSSHVVAIGIHGLILFYLFRAFSQFAD